MVDIGKRWYAKESRREELLPKREGHRARAVLYRSHKRTVRIGSLFPRFASRNFAPTWTLMGAPAPGKNRRKKSAVEGNIGSLALGYFRRGDFSGERIECNATRQIGRNWRGNRYVESIFLQTSSYVRERFSETGHRGRCARGARSTQLH